MASAFIDTGEDLDWLRATHLRGVQLPTRYANFRFAVLQGNEDAPHAVNLYTAHAPDFNDDYLRVTFNHAPPIYCEYREYDGATDKPKA